MIFDSLRRFRQQLYSHLGHSKAALFDLMDAVLTTPSSPSFVQFSLSPLFRRRWSSVYKALLNLRLGPNRLMAFLLPFLPQTTDSPLLVAIDHTSWPRPYAATLQERTYEHHPTPIPGNKPITVGHGFATLAVIPEPAGSWALPLRHERITSFETPMTKALFQVKQLCRRLQRPMILLADSEYANAKFLVKSEGLPCSKLMRIRPNRVLWGRPAAYGGRGRPRRHGDRFALREPETWGPPAQEQIRIDETQGQIRLRVWKNLHFKQAYQQEFSVVRVEFMDRANGSPIWLLWTGELPEELMELRHSYQRRFGVDHWNRLCKQRLHWTLPQLGSPEQAQRWSQVVVMLSWQLWLAREESEESALPWQKPQQTPSPGRVAQGMAGILARIGSPAPEPKPRGKGKGWPEGEKRGKKRRCPTVKKRGKRQKKAS